MYLEKFEDTKGVIRSRKLRAIPAPLVTPVVLLMLRTRWRKSRMGKRPGCGYKKRNLPVVICDTDIP